MVPTTKIMTRLIIGLMFITFAPTIAHAQETSDVTKERSPSVSQFSDVKVERLRAAGPLVYLEVDLTTLEERVAAAPLRGIASDPGQNFAQIYAERTPLYSRHADFTVNAAQGTADAVAAAILAQVTGT